MSTIQKSADVKSLRINSQYSVHTEDKSFCLEGNGTNLRISTDGCVSYSSGIRTYKQFIVNIPACTEEQNLFKIRFGRPSSFLISVECFSKGNVNKYCRDLHDVVFTDTIDDSTITYSSKNISYMIEDRYIIYQITPEHCAQKCVVSVEITCFNEDNDAITITK